MDTSKRKKDRLTEGTFRQRTISILGYSIVARILFHIIVIVLALMIGAAIDFYSY